MKWEEMDGLERSRQFKRLRKLFLEALGKAWSEEFAEYQKANPDDVFPKCMGCHYNAFKED